VSEVRELAYGKINLCLFLGGPRPDGRHELVTLFESVSLADELDFTYLPAGSDQVICDGVEGPNLVADALRGLRARGWTAPPVMVEVTKRIPVAAGLGGGSADAAATLRTAPRLAPVAEASLVSLAAELGADVPAALRPGVALGTGAGNVVRPCVPLAPHAVTLLPASEALSTAAVYAEADRLGLPRTADDLRARLRELEGVLAPRARLPDALLVNDLEPAARSLAPGIDGALAAVRGAGAEHALACGSGPTVAGVFWGADAAERSAAAAEQLLGRFPGAASVVPVSSSGSGTIGPA
jgi:4-diphosphocytidyl-2-C-methyl-D-erythritol kinase